MASIIVHSLVALYQGCQFDFSLTSPSKKGLFSTSLSKVISRIFDITMSSNTIKIPMGDKT